MKCQAPKCDKEIPEDRLKRNPRVKTCCSDCGYAYRQDWYRRRYWKDGHERKKFGYGRESDEADMPVSPKHRSIKEYKPRQLQHLPESRFLQWFKPRG